MREEREKNREVERGREVEGRERRKRYDNGQRKNILLETKGETPAEVREENDVRGGRAENLTIHPKARPNDGVGCTLAFFNVTRIELHFYRYSRISTGQSGCLPGDVISIWAGVGAPCTMLWTLNSLLCPLDQHGKAWRCGVEAEWVHIVKTLSGGSRYSRATRNSFPCRRSHRYRNSYPLITPLSYFGSRASDTTTQPPVNDLY